MMTSSAGSPRLSSAWPPAFFPLHRAFAWLAPLLLALLLSACGGGGKPVRESSTPRLATTGVASDCGARTMVRSGGGTGFYLDDGPGDLVPSDLDCIPDAVPRLEPLHRPALRPYTVMGQRFVPITELGPYQVEGHGSWYGRRFHGKPTSTGERYDMFAMTAAHPTLPLPSYARVTNLQNGRSVIVRVNDRGPFLRGRVIDLSYAAAHRLGYVNAGSAQVRVESITPADMQGMALAARSPTGGRPTLVAAAPASQAPRNAPVARPVSAAPQLAVAEQAQPALHSPVTPPPLPEPAPLADEAMRPLTPLVGAPTPAEPALEASTGGAFVQLGVFSSESSAQGLMVRVRDELYDFSDRASIVAAEGRYRVQVGPFPSLDAARLEAGRIGARLRIAPYVVSR